MNDLVSVIIPYYRGEDYIIETLDCVKNQIYREIEIILVNDGSDTAFLNKIKNSDDYANLKIIHQQNGGQSSARNKGVKISTGKYLLFLDCDDIIGPYFIEKTVAILRSDSDIKVAFSKGKYFEAKSGEWKLPEFAFKSLLVENSIPITALIYKEDFNNTGGFDVNLSFLEDWDLWISILKGGGKIYKINEFLFFYRIRNSQKSLSNVYKKNADFLGDNFFKIYCKHYELYKKYGIGFYQLFEALRESHKYKKKYYNSWFRVIIYKFFKPKKYTEIYRNL